MKKLFALFLTVLMTASLFAGCGSSVCPAASNSSSATEEVVPTTENPTEKDEATIDPAETIHTEPVFPIEMTMEELEAKLGYGYMLPDENAYPGSIISKYDESLGENGGILLEYTFDGFTVYAMKYEETEIDAYDGWEPEYAERGSEVINGVEVRFRGQSMVPDYRGIAFWRQNGYQYILNCETAPSTDIMTILPIFIENK
jgi:hypothetical protein